MKAKCACREKACTRTVEVLAQRRLLSLRNGAILSCGPYLKTTNDDSVDCWIKLDEKIIRRLIGTLNKILVGLDARRIRKTSQG